MPLDSEQIAELAKLVGVSRKRELNFAICLGKKPDSTVFLMHRMRGPEILLREAKKLGETKRLAHGTVSSKGKVMTLNCLDEPPSVLARLTKLFLATIGTKMSIQVMDAEGNALQSALDGDEDEFEEDDTAADDPLKPRWEQAFAHFDPLVSRAVSEGTVADPSKLRAAWAYAIEIAGQGDFSGALKVAARVKTALGEGAPAPSNETAKNNFESFADRLAPRVKAVLKGRVGPFEEVRKLWNFGNGKAEETPPEYKVALQALRKMVGFLEQAEAALIASDGTPDAIEGVKSGLVDERLAEIASGKELLAAVKAHGAALKIAFVQKPEAEPTAKTYIAAIQSAVSGNDLDTGRAELAKIEALIEDAAAHHARQQEALRQKLAGMKGDLTRLLALPGETKYGLRLQRKMTAYQTLVPKDINKDDLSAARAKLKELEDVIVEMAAEEVLITRALAYKDQFTREYGALRGDLDLARTIYEVSPSFKPDIKAFKSLDKSVGIDAKDRSYAAALAKMPRLIAATNKLTARNAEFDQLLRDQTAAARGFARAEAAKTKAIKRVAMTTPDAQVARTALETAFATYKAHYDQKSWSDAVALEADVRRLAAELLAMRDGCNALKQTRTDAKRIYQAARDRIRAALPAKDVLPRMKEFRAEFSALHASYNENYFNIRDMEEALATARRLEQLANSIEGLADEHTEAEARQAAVTRAFKDVRPRYKTHINIVPHSEEYLAAQKNLTAVFERFWAAYLSGSEDAMGLLQEVEEAMRAQAACASSQTPKAARDAQKAAQEIAARLNPAVKASITVCMEYAPDLREMGQERGAIAKEFNGYWKAKRWLEAVEAGERLFTKIDDIKAAAAGLTAARDTLRLAVEARWSDGLRANITTVLGYEAVTATMEAEQDAIEALRDKVVDAVGKGFWDLARVHLDALEPLVDDKIAFRPTYEQLVEDMAWIEKQMPALEKRMQIVDAMKPVNREIADALSQFDTLAKSMEDNFASGDFSLARDEFPKIIAAVDKLDAEDQVYKDALAKGEAMLKAYRAIRPDVTKANAFKPYTKTLERLITAYDDQKYAYFDARDGFNFDTALAIVPRIKKAADALFQMTTEHDAAAVAAPAKAAKAKQAIEGMTPTKLKELDASQQLALLDGLRATQDELDDDQRACQRKIYAAMELDDEFKGVDDVRRAALTDFIKGDTDLMDAKDGWEDAPVADRLRLLEKTLAKECELYGMPVPAVQTFSEPPGDEGFFSPSTNTINLNIHPDADFHDFYECIDTIVHENAHNYQDYIVLKLSEGLIAPGDPEYKQALMFATNDANGGYVQPKEDKAVYAKQPSEEHAWKVGGGIAAALQEADEDSAY